MPCLLLTLEVSCHPPPLPLQEDEMVGRMLQFRRDMQGVLHNSLAGHAEFSQALKEGEFICCCDWLPACVSYRGI